jgi:hypothetical protein
MRTSIPLRLLALLIIVLAACAANPVATPNPTTLDQTYTSADGALTFNYPTGWAVREEAEQVFLATNDQLLQSTGASATATPGQFAIGIIVFASNRVPGLSEDAAPLDVLSAFAPFLSGASEAAEDPSAATFGQSTEITVGSRRAARAEGSSGADQTLLVVLELQPGVFSIIGANSAPGELARFEPTLLAIAQTMQYAEPAVEATDAPQPETTAEASS